MQSGSSMHITWREQVQLLHVEQSFEMYWKLEWNPKIDFAHGQTMQRKLLMREQLRQHVLFMSIFLLPSRVSTFIFIDL